MEGSTILWISIGAGVLCIVAAAWTITNSKGYKSRGRRRSESAGKDRKRATDRRKLDKREKQLYNQAQEYIKQGKIIPAARSLEQLNMPREAIQTLEDHGEIDEAANILMRMQRHNRAGVVYARNGMWEKAAKCFRMANMPLEAAKCAREAADYGMAAEFFAAAQRYEDAAECLVKVERNLEAARLFAAAGKFELAAASYRRLIKSADNMAEIELEDNEVRALVDFVSQGNTDPYLLDFLVHRNRIVPIVQALVAQGMVKQASEAYLRVNVDIGPNLIASVSYEDRSAETLAELFTSVSHHAYAGMVYERMEEFERGGNAFEKAEDLGRAIYCFERSGNDVKVKMLKDRLKLGGAKGASTPVIQPDNPFAISAMTEEGPAFSSVDDERTEMMDVNEVAADEDRPGLGNFSMTEEENTAEIPADPAPVPESTQRSEPEEIAAPAPVAVAPDPKPQENENDIEGRDLFHKARFFSDLDFMQKNKLWNTGETISIAAEDLILSYNDEPRGVYVIISGKVSVYRRIQGTERYVDKMKESDSFGELWLLADQPSSVKFVAATDAKIRVIDRDKFDDLLDRDGAIARKLYKRFTMRLLKRLLTSRKQTENRNAS